MKTKLFLALALVATQLHAADTLTLAAIPKSTGGEFWETVGNGAKKAAKDLGITLKWEGTVTETEIAEQNKIIENMVNLGVQGIALAPLNQKAMKKQVANAVAAGIPVVIFDSNVDGDAHSSFVATDNKNGGVIGGKELVRLIGDKKGAKVMCMRFVQGTGSTEARAQGAIETVKAAGYTVVADPYPDTGTIEGCKNAAVNTLEKFVKDGALDLDGIFAANLYSTIGVESALDDLRKGGVKVNVKFVGFDTSKKLVEDVQAGKIDALVAQNPEKMGYLAVETLYKVVKKQEVPKMVDTGTVLVTKDKLANDAEVRKLVGLGQSQDSQETKKSAVIIGSTREVVEQLLNGWSTRVSNRSTASRPIIYYVKDVEVIVSYQDGKAVGVAVIDKPGSGISPIPQQRFDELIALIGGGQPKAQDFNRDSSGIREFSVGNAD